MLIVGGVGVQIRYMGAKHHLAPRVAHVVSTLRQGTFLDLFSGMCSVAGAMAPSGRRTWCNDAQEYAALAARVLIASQTGRPSVTRASGLLRRYFLRNHRHLAELAGTHIEAEKKAFADASGYERARANWYEWLGPDRSAPSFRHGSHSLITQAFAFAYFGVAQSVALDSLRYAIDRAVISRGEREWYLLAWLQAASHLASAPGHFAEFLNVRDATTLGRVRSVRRRDVWDQFLLELSRIAPFGTKRWRGGNVVLRDEAVDIADALNSLDWLRPGVVYADPPYSRAQYSRYYHVLETMTLYDYPPLTGNGRYRPERLQTPFSQLSRVRGAFHSMVQAVAQCGADLVLSYPSDGLLYEAGDDPRAVLRLFYPKVRTAIAKAATHSTMGAAPGKATTPVTEFLYAGSHA